MQAFFGQPFQLKKSDTAWLWLLPGRRKVILVPGINVFIPRWPASLNFLEQPVTTLGN